MTEYDDDLWHRARSPQRRAEVERLERERFFRELETGLAALFGELGRQWREAVAPALDDAARALGAIGSVVVDRDELARARSRSAFRRHGHG